MTKGLYSLFLRRLCEIKTTKEIIPFPLVFEKICRNFSITKKDCWKILYFFEDEKIIKIYSGHGIKILKKKISQQKELELFKKELHRENKKEISAGNVNPEWVNKMMELIGKKG